MADTAQSGIYEIVNLANGKRYVGSAKHIERRWRQHRTRLKDGKHHSRHLQAAWSKYGQATFEFRVMRFCEPASLIAEEQAEFERDPPAYNVCSVAGSTLGRNHSPETRAKIAARATGKNRPPRDAEHRAKLSAALKGRTKSPEHMAALQAGRARHKRTPEQLARVSDTLRAAYVEGRRSRDRSPEYRAKIAESLRGRKATPEHRAKQSAAQRGVKRGPYHLDPAKVEARKAASRLGALRANAVRWGKDPNN